MARSWSVFFAFQYLFLRCHAYPKFAIEAAHPQITAAPALGAISEKELLRRQDSCTWACAICALYAPCENCVSLSAPAGIECCTSKLADQSACPTANVPHDSTIFVYTLGTLTLYGNPTSLVIGSETLTPGGPLATADSHTLSIPTNATSGGLVEDGTPTTLGTPISTVVGTGSGPASTTTGIPATNTNTNAGTGAATQTVTAGTNTGTNTGTDPGTAESGTGAGSGTNTNTGSQAVTGTATAININTNSNTVIDSGIGTGSITATATGIPPSTNTITNQATDTGTGSATGSDTNTATATGTATGNNVSGNLAASTNTGTGLNPNTTTGAGAGAGTTVTAGPGTTTGSNTNTNTSAPALSTYTINGIPFTGNPTSLVAGTVTLTPGGPDLTSSGHTIAIPTSAAGGQIRVDGSTINLTGPNAAANAGTGTAGATLGTITGTITGTGK